MTVEFDAIYIIRLILVLIMCFSWGMRLDVSRKTKEKAKLVNQIILIVLWLFIIFC